MTELTISNVPIELEYAITSAPDTGPFAIPFEFFDLADIVVVEYDANGDEVATYGHQNGGTVTGTGVDGGYSSGNWVPTTGHGLGTLKIYRSTVIDRSTNFPETGPVNIGTLNDQLNKIVAIEQELAAQKDKYISLPADAIATTSWDLSGRAACNAGEGAGDACLATNRQVAANGPNWVYDDDVQAAIGSANIFNTVVQETGIEIQGREPDQVMDLITHFFCHIQNRDGLPAEFYIRYRYQVDCYSEVVKEFSSDYRIKVGALAAIPFHFMDIEQDIPYGGGNCTLTVAIVIKPLGANSENLYTESRNLSVTTMTPR